MAFFETMAQQAAVKQFRAPDPFGASPLTPYGAECIVGDIRHHNTHVGKAQTCCNTHQSQFITDQIAMMRANVAAKTGCRGSPFQLMERAGNDRCHRGTLRGIRNNMYPVTTVTHLEGSMEKCRVKRRRDPSKYAPTWNEAERIKEQVAFHNKMIGNARTVLEMTLDKKHAFFKESKALRAFPFAPINAQMPVAVMTEIERRKHKAKLKLIDVTRVRPIPKHFHAPSAKTTIDETSLEKIVAHTLHSSNPEVAAMIAQHTANRLPNIAKNLGLDPAHFKAPPPPVAPELPSIIRHLEFGRRSAPPACITTSQVRSSAHISSHQLDDDEPISPFSQPAASTLQYSETTTPLEQLSPAKASGWAVRRRSTASMGMRFDADQASYHLGAMAWDELTEMWDKMQSVMRNAREEARSLLSPAHQAVALLAASKQRSEDAFLQTSVFGLARHIRPVVRGSAIILGDMRGDTGEHMADWWARRCCRELELDEDCSVALATQGCEHRSVVGGKKFVLDALLLELDRELQGAGAEKGSEELDARLTEMITSVFDLCDEVASQQGRALDAVDVFLSQRQRASCVRTLYTAHCVETKPDQTDLIDEDEWMKCLTDEQRERMNGLKKELSELDVKHRERVEQLVADACAEGDPNAKEDSNDQTISK